MTLAFLKEQLNLVPSFSYPSHSRAHLLNSFQTHNGHTCFVKREDELGFGISGIKLRKYRVLIPYLLQQGFKEAVVIGGAFSNHVLSMTQLLIESGIQPTLFLKEPQPVQKTGNFLLTQALLPSSSIKWVSKQDWPSVYQKTLNYSQTRPKSIVIPEAAMLFPSFLGALSLPLDILQNEHELGLEFQDVFLEAGSGYSAAALLLVFSLLKKQTMCHLVILAGTQQSFIEELHKLHKEFEIWLGKEVSFPTRFRCLECSIAPSFGSTNQKLFEFIVQTARAEGFFLDPIYSGKLFYEAKKNLSQNTDINANTLLIHSGGALTLSGFQSQLEKAI